MLGRSLHPTRAQCSAAGPAAGRQPLLQPACQLLLLTNCQHNLNGLSSSIAQLPVAYGASIAPSRHRQQQQLHNSTHIVRVVALQQDDSFSVDNTRDCFSNSSTQDVLDVVPEAGLLPEVVARLDSNSTASTSSSSNSLSSKLAATASTLAAKQPWKGGSSSSSSSRPTPGNPIYKPAAAAAAARPSAGHSAAAVVVAAASAADTSSTATPANAAASSSNSSSSSINGAAAAAAPAAVSPAAAPGGAVRAALYPPSERSQIQESWDALMRWSKSFRRQKQAFDPIGAAEKVVVFGGGSFGTAMGTSLAHKKADLDVVLLLRDPYLCHDINSKHINTKYLADFQLPRNVRATTDATEAITGASYAVHAVPVQHSRSFLASIKDVLPKDVPIICVSKGLEVGSGCMMSEVIPSALGRKQPAVFLSGPSFAKEVMQGRPTGVVAACKDINLGREIQELFASPNMRVNTTTDVTGVEICGALKNVLAIAAGIVEGLDLGHNALAALIAQGCAEIRWLSQKVGAKPATISGLSGLGDIMLTCYGDLSRNRSVGIRLGRGEKLEDILSSSSQVAEGVATAGVVVGLARKYRVSLPVLTAVAQVLDNNLTPAQAVTAVMNLPQIDEM